MKFAYEDLSDTQFERLIIFLCQHLLGISVQGFSEGPDGGRDAKFVGTAELHPSKTAPWNGTTIIQAKHTNGYNRSFSESDFFSENSDKNVIGKEISRVIKLRKNSQLDNYMLFANRRLSGNAESKIRRHIAKKCEIKDESIYLCGTEQLEIFMKKFSDIPKWAELDPIDSPLIVSPDELAEIVESLANQMNVVSAALYATPRTRVTYEQKNEINNMSDEYAEAQRRKYLKETKIITDFLAAPENFELLGRYQSVVDEFQLKIISKRKNYQSFDDVMEYIVDLLFGRDPVLRQHKRITRAILFYMYWNCDIGENGDVEAD